MIICSNIRYCEVIRNYQPRTQRRSWAEKSDFWNKIANYTISVKPMCSGSLPGYICSHQKYRYNKSKCGNLLLFIQTYREVAIIWTSAGPPIFFKTVNRAIFVNISGKTFIPPPKKTHLFGHVGHFLGKTEILNVKNTKKVIFINTNQFCQTMPISTLTKSLFFFRKGISPEHMS